MSHALMRPSSANGERERHIASVELYLPSPFAVWEE